MTEPQDQKKRLIVLGFYWMCLLAALFSFIPLMVTMNIGFTAIFLILIAAYVRRSYTEEDSFEHHHLTFIIRSLWIYSLFASIGLIGGGWMVWENGDREAIDTLVNAVMGGAIPTEADFDQTARAYMIDNQALMHKALVMWMFPSTLYLVWRLGRGILRAFRNYRVQNIYAWL